MKHKLDNTYIKIAGAVIIVLLAFFAGTKYGGLNSSSRGGFQGGNFTGGGKNGGGMMRGNRGGALVGEIVSKDDKSITIKLKDGGSKIVFFSDSTGVVKADPGSISDLTPGQQIVVTGSVNTDGSETAQSIQIRPNLPANK